MIALRSWNRFGWVVVTLIALAGVAGSPTPAAEGVPDHQRDFFSDFTGLINDHDRIEIDEVLKEASQASGIHAVLVFVKRMSDHPGLPQNAKDFAYQLAKTWKVGNAKNGKGVLVFFSLEDRKFQVVKTKNLPLQLTDSIANSMKGGVTLALTDKDYARAMKKAAENIARLLPGSPGQRSTAGSAGGAANGHSSTPIAATGGSHNGSSDYETHSGRSSAGTWIVWIIAGVIGFVILIAVISAFSSRGTYAPSYTPGYGGGYYQPHYGGYYDGGGGNFFTGMLVGGMMNGMFGGGSRPVEHHYHHGGSSSSGGVFGGSFGGGSDSSGGSWGDTSASFGDGGGFSAFGGGSFDGGSSGGEW